MEFLLQIVFILEYILHWMMIKNNDILYLIGIIDFQLCSLNIQLQIELIVVAIAFEAHQHL